MGEDLNHEFRLDWSSAEVSDGELVVALDDKPPKEWKDAFERTTRLLNRGTWDEVTLKKGRVSLRSIQPGEEDRVRHFLETVVLEANSVLAPRDDADPDAEADGPAQDDAAENSEDREMTERLRSFAAPTGDG